MIAPGCQLSPALFAAAVAQLAAPSPGSAETMAIAGTNVVPHVQSANLRWREPVDQGGLGARVELFLRNTSDQAIAVTPEFQSLFGGKSAAELLESGEWAWHDTPSARAEARYDIPPGAIVVWSFNGSNASWGAGTRHTLSLGPGAQELDLPIVDPDAWVSAVTFLSDRESVRPDRMVVHVANETWEALQLRRCRLWLPPSRDRFLVLTHQPWMENLERFPESGSIPHGEKGGFSAPTGELPLTYAAVEVELGSPGGQTRSLWAHLRIKQEVFDISGGWVASDVGGRNSLTLEPYLKTLKRMHINTGQIEEVSGYTDNPDLYSRYPLKRFNRLADTERYGSDAVLPHVHSVEFLGEPQYGGGRPVPPQEVWEAFEPYQGSRLHTSVTHSEERIWRHYAGLSDYPHYDAYRITAPAADSWRRYDRWGGESISWGAPLETITDLTRSLRHLNRPRPIAYWSQGAHDGWGSRSRDRTSPTPDELRAQAFHALAHRVTSIYWFNLSLKSILKFPDLIQPITEVNRVALALAPLTLSGDAFEYHRATNDGRPSWDLSSVIGADGGVLFANDLTYSPDPETNSFTFSNRDAELRFKLPRYLSSPAEVFKIDAGGVHGVEHRVENGHVFVEDRVRVAGIYVVAARKGLRSTMSGRLEALVKTEEGYGFDPAADPDDLETLRGLLPQPGS